jgi:hypothetical protein
MVKFGKTKKWLTLQAMTGENYSLFLSTLFSGGLGAGY